ncbi:YkvA family protein [Oceanisphaera psychrotolerans]|uniref:DUF1232 domain-containing protein n=1 Tax=Oceanisphaera psychrotolerans TaxID=1414654 RepID=A0A1J4QIK5_9GAMM|nr:YkvA family protein [Oceanisphaera psychrotolerans]OIN12334.1 hypothetical protein BFR47_01185 [Oceanisphaera psychrotolerans]
MQQDKNELANIYSEQSFWDKIRYSLKTAGIEVIRKCLWLYYAAQKPETPLWAKTVVYSALAYFILPIDAIPDLLPGMGYTDDLIVLTAAIVSISLYVDEEVEQQAERKLRKYFG